MEERRAAAGEYPQREGQYVCQYYMRTGMYKFGASCKYHQPRQRGESPSLVMPNIHGYLLLQNEKECSHYMNIDQCKFAMTCEFQHPQLVVCKLQHKGLYLFLCQRLFCHQPLIQ